MLFEAAKNKIFSQIKKFHELKDYQIKSLEDFVLLLLQENQQFNFIGKSTIETVWDRHILDSAQLLRLIVDKNVKFADFGSGAGLPGIILSILGLKEVHLIEKSFRKCEFLRQAKLLSSNRIFIHQSDLEKMTRVEFDCIVSRALAPLEKLLAYCKNFLKEGGYCLFLKGKNLSNEIATAKEKFKFEYELQPSLTSEESSIIKISNIYQLNNSN